VLSEPLNPSGATTQGDHPPGKLEKVREFESGQGNVRCVTMCGVIDTISGRFTRLRTWQNINIMI